MMRKYDFTPIDLGEQMDASKDDLMQPLRR